MRVRGDSLGSIRLETRLPHLDAGGTRSFRDIRETPRRDRACPHRALPDARFDWRPEGLVCEIALPV